VGKFDRRVLCSGQEMLTRRSRHLVKNGGALCLHQGGPCGGKKKGDGKEFFAQGKGNGTCVRPNLLRQGWIITKSPTGVYQRGRGGLSQQHLKGVKKRSMRVKKIVVESRGGSCWSEQSRPTRLRPKKGEHRK